MTRFAQRLKELRQEKHLSQRELAAATGFTQACIAKWENEIIVPTFDSAVVIAKFFNVSLDFLAGLTEV